MDDQVVQYDVQGYGGYQLGIGVLVCEGMYGQYFDQYVVECVGGQCQYDGQLYWLVQCLGEGEVQYGFQYYGAVLCKIDGVGDGICYVKIQCYQIVYVVQFEFVDQC